MFLASRDDHINYANKQIDLSRIYLLTISCQKRIVGYRSIGIQTPVTKINHVYPDLDLSTYIHP